MDPNNDPNKQNTDEQPLDQQQSESPEAVQPETDQAAELQQPQAEQQPQVEPEPTPQFVQPQPVNAPIATAQHTNNLGDQKSRLAMMAFAFFAGPLGIARIYIGDKLGYVRLWVYVASIVLTIVPFVNILTGFVMIALLIWGVVDFFLLKNRQTDADGKPLYTNDRDDKAVRILNIVFIVSLVLTLIITLFMLIAFAAFISQGINIFNGSPQVTPDSFQMDTRDYQDTFQPST